MVLGERQAHHFRIGLERWGIHKGFLRHPAFDIGSSDAGSKQTDGDTGFLVDPSSEIEADGGESRGVFWFADVPTPFDVRLGGRGKVGFDAEVSD